MVVQHENLCLASERLAEEVGGREARYSCAHDDKVEVLAGVLRLDGPRQQPVPKGMRRFE